jgi:hypothetical protein
MLPLTLVTIDMTAGSHFRVREKLSNHLQVPS